MEKKIKMLNLSKETQEEFNALAIVKQLDISLLEFEYLINAIITEPKAIKIGNFIDKSIIEEEITSNIDDIICTKFLEQLKLDDCQIGVREDLEKSPRLVKIT